MQIAPENTMVAFEYATRDDIFGLESDIIIRWNFVWCDNL